MKRPSIASLVILMVITAIATAILFSRENEEAWQVVESTTISARVQIAGPTVVFWNQLHPIESWSDGAVIDDSWEVIRDYNAPNTRFHASIATYRAENHQWLIAYGQTFNEDGRLRDRVFCWRNNPRSPEQLPVEAEIGYWWVVDAVQSRYYYFAIGWVNCSDVETFTLTFSDGHAVTLNAQEHEFFILERMSYEPLGTMDVVVKF